MEEKDQIKLRMIKLLEVKFPDRKWIQMNKESLSRLMVIGYQQAIVDSTDQGLEEDVILT